MEVDSERQIDRKAETRAGGMSSRTCRQAAGPDLAGWPGAQCSERGWTLWGPSQALGSPFLSWSQATPYLILAGEEPAGE